MNTWHIYYFYLFFRYVTSVLPSGGEDLNGDEADKIIKFKNSLGIDDPDAAAMHMEVLLVFLQKKSKEKETDKNMVSDFFVCLFDRLVGVSPGKGWKLVIVKEMLNSVG